MQTHSIDIADFSENHYKLIGIHTTLEDCKLAYLLNRELKTQLKKTNHGLDFENKNNTASYSIYSYNNEEYGYDWHLIANCFTEQKTEQIGMLELTTETKSYLIPEHKKVDYFLKIVGDYKQECIEKTINRIKNIQQVVASYSIDINKLKSKEILIF